MDVNRRAYFSIINDQPRSKGIHSPLFTAIQTGDLIGLYWAFVHYFIYLASRTLLYSSNTHHVRLSYYCVRAAFVIAARCMFVTTGSLHRSSSNHAH